MAGEFDRSAAGVGESSRRAMEDVADGRQARATDAEIRKEREKLRDISGDGGGEVGASDDGRAPTAEDDDAAPKRRASDEDEDARDERRRMADALENERARLTRR